MKASHVLAAMGVPADIAGGFLRVSFGPETQRERRRRLPGAIGGASPPRVRAPRRHDLSRLPGDDAGRAGSRGGDAAVDRGEFRQPAFAVALGTRGRGGDRSRARARSSGRSGSSGGSLAFTGSATEALNWALKGTIEKRVQGRNRIVTVATEHAAVLDTCEWLEAQGHDVTRAAGRARRAGRPRRARGARSTSTVAIVAVMLVNNEIGVIQPVAEIARWRMTSAR